MSTIAISSVLSFVFVHKPRIMTKKKAHRSGVGADPNFFSQCNVNHFPPAHSVRVLSVILCTVGACWASIGQFLSPEGLLSVIVALLNSFALIDTDTNSTTSRTKYPCK